MNTEVENLNAEIQRLKAESELKTGWISLITHDFKEVFSSLSWIIEAVEAGTLSKDDFFKLLPRIQQDAKKNLRTVTDTSDWIRTQLGEFKTNTSKIFALDLFIQLRKEFEARLRDKKLEFQFKGNESLIFQNDQFLVLFILRKLLDNAIKYSHPDHTIQFEALEADNTVILSICDHGTGMMQEAQDSLFTFQSPVFQGTNGEIGAGLSLKIAKNFVTLLQGKLEVKSTENVGTKISIILPHSEK